VRVNVVSVGNANKCVVAVKTVEVHHVNAVMSVVPIPVAALMKEKEKKNN
jgi:hypothetical protein